MSALRYRITTAGEPQKLEAGFEFDLIGDARRDRLSPIGPSHICDTVPSSGFRVVRNALDINLSLEADCDGAVAEFAVHNYCTDC